MTVTTATLKAPATAPATAPARSGSSSAPAGSDNSTARRLLRDLADVCAWVAELDPDRLGSTTPSGRLLSALAELARTATAQLGSPAGPPLGHAPGIVVVRDLAGATRQLERAATAATGGTCDADLASVSGGLRAAVARALPLAA